MRTSVLFLGLEGIEVLVGLRERTPSASWLRMKVLGRIVRANAFQVVVSGGILSSSS